MIKLLTIKEVKKEQIYPLFGMADKKNRVAMIREDLSKSEKRFIQAHEVSHCIEDQLMDKNRVHREIIANLTAGVIHPIGFIRILFKSIFSIARLKMYWRVYVVRK